MAALIIIYKLGGSKIYFAYESCYVLVFTIAGKLILLYTHHKIVFDKLLSSEFYASVRQAMMQL